MRSQIMHLACRDSRPEVYNTGESKENSSAKAPYKATIRYKMYRLLNLQNELPLCYELRASRAATPKQ